MKFYNQIIGIVRFSFPASSGWKVSNDDIQAVEDQLYDPDRMKYRFELFERFCLPSLQSQTDQKFIILVIVGDNMPEVFLTRLLALMAPLSNAVVVPVGPDSHYKCVQTALRMVPKDDHTHRTTFRLDDDDMVRFDYVKRLRRMCFQMGQIQSSQPFAVAYNRGYFLDLKEPGKPELYIRRQDRPLGLGLSLTTPIRDRRNVFAWNHLYVPAYVNCYSNANVPMFVRTIHDHNDGNRKINKDYNELVPDENRDKVARECFGMDWDELSAPLRLVPHSGLKG